MRSGGREPEAQHCLRGRARWGLGPPERGCTDPVEGRSWPRWAAWSAGHAVTRSDTRSRRGRQQSQAWVHSCGAVCSPWCSVLPGTLGAGGGEGAGGRTRHRLGPSVRMDTQPSRSGHLQSLRPGAVRGTDADLRTRPTVDVTAASFSRQTRGQGHLVPRHHPPCHWARSPFSKQHGGRSLPFLTVMHSALRAGGTWEGGSTWPPSTGRAPQARYDHKRVEPKVRKGEGRQDGEPGPHSLGRGGAQVPSTPQPRYLTTHVHPCSPKHACVYTYTVK